mmetsp:Transcript_15324/g.46714  ORF Transcript_15324/g.46714 Transcript_15324/m.46714 type:complete len:281 (-) Transcript_15324:543-1385(-)
MAAALDERWRWFRRSSRGQTAATTRDRHHPAGAPTIQRHQRHCLLHTTSSQGGRRATPALSHGPLGRCGLPRSHDSGLRTTAARNARDDSPDRLSRSADSAARFPARDGAIAFGPCWRALGHGRCHKRGTRRRRRRCHLRIRHCLLSLSRSRAEHPDLGALSHAFARRSNVHFAGGTVHLQHRRWCRISICARASRFGRSLSRLCGSLRRRSGVHTSLCTRDKGFLLGEPRRRRTGGYGHCEREEKIRGPFHRHGLFSIAMRLRCWHRVSKRLGGAVHAA